MKKVVLIAAIVAATAVSANAATFADMINSLRESVAALGGLMKLFIPLCGAYCIGMGLFKFLGIRTGGERDGSTWHTTWQGALMWIIPGAALLGISAFAAVSTESVGLSGTIDF